MANELTLSGLRIQFAKANVPSVDFSPPSLSVTVSGTANMDNTQDVGFASEEAILLGDCTTGGYWYVQNMDATNYVSLRSATGAADMVKLLAGQWAIFPCPATAPYAQANTAAVKVRFLRFAL